eukprot:Opistho-2@71116
MNSIIDALLGTAETYLIEPTQGPQPHLDITNASGEQRAGELSPESPAMDLDLAWFDDLNFNDDEGPQTTSETDYKQALGSHPIFPILAILVARAGHPHILTDDNIAKFYDDQFDTYFRERNLNPNDFQSHLLLSGAVDVDKFVLGALHTYAALNKELNSIRTHLQSLSSSIDISIHTAINGSLQNEYQRRAGSAKRRAETQVE